MRREIALVFRARTTWIVLALTSLLVGHGWLLALDVYTVSSRSALASTLQLREMDPLLGIVRPTLGALDLSAVFFAPALGAWPLAIEKERGTWVARAVALGSTHRVVVQKLIAGWAGALTLLVPVVVLLALSAIGAGTLDAIETSVALVGEALRLLVFATAGVAAAAWTRSYASALTLGIAFAIVPWAIDAGADFSAIAWLGSAAPWSIDAALEPFTRGVVGAGALSWAIVAIAGASVVAVLGGSFRGIRIPAAVATTAIALVLLRFASSWHRAWDWSEERRSSLPPDVIAGLRAIPAPIALEVALDRDDPRRRQLERDVVAKLWMARPDARLETPLDGTATARSADYGIIRVHVGEARRETRSTSRRELVSLVFDASGWSVPSWDGPSYPGHPIVVEGRRRTFLATFAYGVFPLVFVLVGWRYGRRRVIR